jgi:hypothetical protein
VQNRLEDVGKNSRVNPAGIAVGLIATFGPWTLKWLLGEWSYALIIPGAIATIVFLVRFASNFFRARNYRSVMRPDKLIARWEIMAEQWRQVSELQYQRNKKAAMIIFIVFAAVFWGIGIAGLFSSHPTGRFAGVIIAVPFTALFWYLLIPRHLPRFRNPHVVLSRAGMVVNGRVFSWEGREGLTFDSLRLKEAPVPHLDIAYHWPVKNPGPRGPRSEGNTALVPVPPGWEGMAKDAVEALTAIGRVIKEGERPDSDEALLDSIVEEEIHGTVKAQ